MLVSEIFQNSVGPLHPESLLDELFTEDFPDGVQYVPVLKGTQFLGFFPIENLILDKEIYETVSDCDLMVSNQFVGKSQHIFEAIPLFKKSGIPVLPVINEENQFEGVLTLESVFELFSGSLAFQSDGGLIVLSVTSNSYSLSEISRLVESNQAKILFVLVESDPLQPIDLLVHIKVNQLDLSRVVATLERFDYKVVEVHHKSESTSVDLERLDQLMKYLGI
jgi:CBS domain containing-hemolysin-like protein